MKDRLAVERAVERILRAVEARGDAALRELTRRFDGARRGSIEVGLHERQAGARLVDAPTRAALRLAGRRIAAFAKRQKRSLRPFRLRQDGVRLEQRLLPVERVGVYVPGGRYPLASSVLMGVIPARIAGCAEVVLCTPPGRDGAVAPEILAAAEIAGVDRIFAVGGAQAIAALACGTETVPRVDLIVGPGNRYVAAAKARVAGRVGIDFVAGPTELMVIADGASDPERVAADLLAQAEHDRDARLWLVALKAAPVAAIRRRLARGLAGLPHENRAAARVSLGRLRVLRAAGEKAAAAIANRMAPEHLSLQMAAPRRLVPHLRHYGSLFLGSASAVAFGDYLTGPNHVLPTGGAARHSGGLSVLRFLRPVTIQEVGERAIARLAPPAERLAALEGLEAHRESLALRAGRGARPAILFDFDGVLVDSEPAHWRAFRETLRPLGIPLTRARYDARYLAFDDRTALRAMLDDAAAELLRCRAAPGRGRAAPIRQAAGAASSIDRLLRRKRALFRGRFARRIAIPRRAADLLRALGERVPLAIVSGAARVEILRALRKARLTGAFRTIVSAESVRRCKPDPEGYRLALRRLGLATTPGEKSGLVRAAGCLAIEDSPGGIRAARSAGIEVIGIAGSFTPAQLRRAGAMRVVPALHALLFEDLLSPPHGAGRAAAPSRSRSGGRWRGRGRSRRHPG